MRLLSMLIVYMLLHAMDTVMVNKFGHMPTLWENPTKVQYEKPKQANLGDLSCGHNISLKLKSPHGESYNFVFNSPTFSFFELELILGN